MPPKTVPYILVCKGLMTCRIAQDQSSPFSIARLSRGDGLIMPLFYVIEFSLDLGRLLTQIDAIFVLWRKDQEEKSG